MAYIVSHESSRLKPPNVLQVTRLTSAIMSRLAYASISAGASLLHEAGICSMSLAYAGFISSMFPVHSDMDRKAEAIQHAIDFVNGDDMGKWLNSVTRRLVAPQSDQDILEYTRIPTLEGDAQKIIRTIVQDTVSAVGTLEGSSNSKKLNRYMAIYGITIESMRHRIVSDSSTQPTKPTVASGAPKAKATKGKGSASDTTTNAGTAIHIASMHALSEEGLAELSASELKSAIAKSKLGADVKGYVGADLNDSSVRTMYDKKFMVALTKASKKSTAEHADSSTSGPCWLGSPNSRSHGRSQNTGSSVAWTRSAGIQNSF